MARPKNRPAAPGAAPAPAPAPAARPHRSNNRSNRPNLGQGGKRGQQKPANPMATGGGMSANLAAQDPQAAFNSKLTTMGIDPFGSLDYHDWLQNEAYGKVKSAYDVAVQTNPNLTFEAFADGIMADPRAAQAFGPEAYRPHHIQANPRDHYNLMATQAGLNLKGADPYSRWLRGQGWENAADAYGQAYEQNPNLMFGNWFSGMGSANPFAGIR